MARAHATTAHSAQNAIALATRSLRPDRPAELVVLAVTLVVLAVALVVVVAAHGVPAMRGAVGASWCSSATSTRPGAVGGSPIAAAALAVPASPGTRGPGGEGSRPRGVLWRHASAVADRSDPLRIFPLVYGDSHDELERFVRSLGSSPAVPRPSSRKPAEAGPVSSPAHGGPFSPGNRVHSVPYQAKRERVIGRAGVLEQMHHQLTSGRPTAIGHTASFQGIGGLGKTQLAVEYADRYGETYAGGVVWLDADRDLDAQLVKLSDEAQWVDPRSEHQLKLDVALHRLRTHTGCLIVFDNVNDPAAIERYLPVPAAAAHIVVTSRAEQPGFDPIALDVLDTAQSLELLVQEAGRVPANDDERAAAQAIAARLAGLPLALEIAGAYVRHRAPVSWRDYQHLLDESLKQALAGSFLQSLTTHDKDLYATLRVSEAMLGDEPRLAGAVAAARAAGCREEEAQDERSVAVLGSDPGHERRGRDLPGRVRRQLR